MYQSKVTNECGVLKLSVAYPDESEVINQKKEIFIDRSVNAVKQIIFKAELDSLQEYNEWNLNDIRFNSHKPKDLEEKFQTITKEYEFTQYQPPSKEMNETLAIGQMTTDFKGEYFTPNTSEFDLARFSNTIIILDFWYRTCPPCIKSIPQLNRIHSKYESKGVKLFGLNDIDTDSISRKRLIPFLEKENIKYPVVIIDKAVSEKYNVKGYPTLYIIDKNGKIVYSKLGYSENMEKDIDSVLTSIIK